MVAAVNEIELRCADHAVGRCFVFDPFLALLHEHGMHKRARVLGIAPCLAADGDAGLRMARIRLGIGEKVVWRRIQLVVDVDARAAADEILGNGQLGDKMQRNLAVVVLDVHLRAAGFDKGAHARQISGLGGIVERGAPEIVGGCGHWICAGLEQVQDVFWQLHDGSHHERGAAALVALVEALFDRREREHVGEHLGAFVDQSAKERRVTRCVRQCEIRIACEQGRNRLCSVEHRSHMQRGVPGAVLCIHIGAHGAEILDGVDVAAKHGKMQRGAAVCVGLVDCANTARFLQQPAQGCNIAKQRRTVDRCAAHRIVSKHHLFAKHRDLAARIVRKLL
eukprot:comp18612_c0_seq1/m.33597 comp18612_c0_seq1/g.33597  ORF comp18612_c0_seq1/g.33597 comp18612_c0_seq1/m.33597 type:complete len:337 (-) comp18612_c0_seq1:160-1170(-)